MTSDEKKVTSDGVTSDEKKVTSDGVTSDVGVAKVENQVHGCHGLTVTLLFLPKNSLNIAVLIQILFGHGKTMTAMNIYPQLCNALVTSDKKQ